MRPERSTEPGLGADRSHVTCAQVPTFLSVSPLAACRALPLRNQLREVTHEVLVREQDHPILARSKRGASSGPFPLDQVLGFLRGHRDEVLGHVPMRGRVSAQALFRHHELHYEAELVWVRETRQAFERAARSRRKRKR
jgi:hypothetical protein